MKAGAVDLAELQLPPDDGAVARSLSELEQKLSAWNSAVARAQTFFASKWSEFAEMERRSHEMADDLRRFDERRRAAEEMADAAESMARAATQAAQAAATQAPRSSPAPVDEATHEPSGQTRAADVLTDEHTRERASESLGRAMNTEPSEPDGESAAEAPDTTAASSAIDPNSPEGVEAILASLEPETANAIRMRYQAARGAKPIRALIEEYQDEMEEAESLLLSLEPEKAKAVRVRYRLFNGRKSIPELVAEIEAESSSSSSSDRKKSWWKR